ncbi:MAG: hypothetical protein RL187_497, partial [Actinomycetota bacterium]
ADELSEDGDDDHEGSLRTPFGISGAHRAV